MNMTPEGVSSTSSQGGGGMYSLKWNQFESYMSLGLAELLEDEEYSMTDVTLACEGEFIQAHKIALAMSSPFFKQFFKMNRVEKAGITLIALANVKFKELKNIIQFIYHGEVQLSNGDLTDFLAAANLLQIRGLEQSPNIQHDDDTSSFKATPTCSSRVAGLRPASPVSSDLSSSVKLPRLSGLLSAPTDSIPQVLVSLAPVVADPLPLSSLEDSSSTHNFNEEEVLDEVEAMISYDDIKVENIAGYTVDTNHQEDDGSYQDLTGHSGENASETVAAFDKIDISYPEPSFPIILDESSPINESVEAPSFAANSSVGLETSSRRSTRTSAPRNRAAKKSVPLSAHRWDGPLGHCEFCPTRIKTVSRSKCYNCQEYLCAKLTCRVIMKLRVNGSNAPVCFDCVKSVDGTPLPFGARKSKAKKLYQKGTICHRKP